MSVSIFRKKPDALEKARLALVEATAKLADLADRRNELLLASEDDAEIAAIDRQIEDAQRIERARRDSVHLLEQKAAEAERQARAKRRATLIDRNSATLKDTIEIAAKIESAVETLRDLVDELVKKREGVAAAWPFSNTDTNAFLLSGDALRNYIAFEFFRVSARPFGGGLTLPGAKCPNIDFTMQPEKIKSLSTTVTETSDAAIYKMRGNP